MIENNIEFIKQVIEKNIPIHNFLGLKLLVIEKGFVRVRINGDIYNVDDAITLDKNKKHTNIYSFKGFIRAEGVRVAQLVQKVVLG